MANIKNVSVFGTVPFNLNERESMCRRLAFLNTPTSGLRITYGGVPEYKPNSHGGQTAFYEFILEGTEAVSIPWLQGFLDDVLALTGTIQACRVRDIEANESIQLSF